MRGGVRLLFWRCKQESATTQSRKHQGKRKSAGRGCGDLRCSAEGTGFAGVSGRAVVGAARGGGTFVPPAAGRGVDAGDGADGIRVGGLRKETPCNQIDSGVMKQDRNLATIGGTVAHDDTIHIVQAQYT